jgi:hypothetical protein
LSGHANPRKTPFNLTPTARDILKYAQAATHVQRQSKLEVKETAK